MSGTASAKGAVYDVRLTARELRLLEAGISPMFIRPQNLVYFAPLVYEETGNIEFEGDGMSEKNGFSAQLEEAEAIEGIGEVAQQMELVEDVAHVFYDWKIRKAMELDAAGDLSEGARYTIRDVGVAGRLIYKRQAANWLVFWRKGLLSNYELEKRLEYMGQEGQAAD